jgi:tRNA pseudouridine32 synthase/23S rRNA pseudouridine746 synthase
MGFLPPDVSHLPLDVVHADGWLAVVVKPAGLLSCPGTTTPAWDAVTTRVPQIFPEARGSLLVHRLDMATSGLMVIALDPATHVALGRLFARREVEKHYEAIVGPPVVAAAATLCAGESGSIALPLRSDWRSRPRQVVDTTNGRDALTTWTVLATDTHGPGTARLALRPHTGRTHQLRVHLSHPDGLGRPILGDALYGATAGPDERLHLHASRLAFVHPATGAPLSFDAPAPF